MRNISKNIKDLRIRSGLTQDGLAEKLFVTRQTVSNYETGKSRPDIDMLMQIAEVLGTDINIHVISFDICVKLQRIGKTEYHHIIAVIQFPCIVFFRKVLRFVYVRKAIIY